MGGKKQWEAKSNGRQKTWEAKRLQELQTEEAATTEIATVQITDQKHLCT